MSFEELSKSTYAPKKSEFKVSEHTFFATEISYLQRLNISAVQQSGGDYYSLLVVYSITDKGGNHMTLDLLNGLPPEYQEQFFIEAAKVNTQEEVKKKSKSKSK